MSHASPRKSVVIDSMINLFFERISHMDPSLPISDVGDDRCLRLIASCDLRPDLAPYSRPCNTATYTAKRGIYCGGGGVGEAIFVKQFRLLPPCTWSIEPAASLPYQRVSGYLRWSLHYLPCQVVLQFRPTNPLHQSRPTREFRNHRPTSPP